MAHAPPQPAPVPAASSTGDLDAQVERLVRSAAEAASEVRGVAEPDGVPGPHEPSLDELVQAATQAQEPSAPVGHTIAEPRPRADMPLDMQVGAALKHGARATDPPRSPATIGPEVGPIPEADGEVDLPIAAVADPAVARQPESVEDEFADPAEELAKAFADVPLPRVAAQSPLPAAAQAAGFEPAGTVVARPAPPSASPVAEAQPAAPVAPVQPSAVPAPAPASAAPAVAALPVVVAPVSATEPARPSILKRAVSALELAVEPVAMRLGALPKGTRDTIGWVGVGTLFWASVVWVYVLAFAPTGDATDMDPRSYLAAPEGKGGHGAPEGGHGAAKADAGHGAKKETKKKDAPGAPSGGHGDAKSSAAKKPEKKESRGGNAQAKTKKDAHGGKKTADAGGH